MCQETDHTFQDVNVFLTALFDGNFNSKKCFDLRHISVRTLRLKRPQVTLAGNVHQSAMILNRDSLMTARTLRIAPKIRASTIDNWKGWKDSLAKSSGTECEFLTWQRINRCRDMVCCLEGDRRSALTAPTVIHLCLLSSGNVVLCLLWDMKASVQHLI